MVLQLLLAVLSRVLSPVLYPFSRIIALWLWSGRNLLKVAAFAREGSLHAVGWLSVPVPRRLQPWAAMFDMRRWHVVVGAFLFDGVFVCLVTRRRKTRRENRRAFLRHAETGFPLLWSLARSSHNNGARLVVACRNGQSDARTDARQAASR